MGTESLIHHKAFKLVYIKSFQPLITVLPDFTKLGNTKSGRR